MEGWIKTIFDTMCLGTSAAGLLPADKPTYDFKLDHWGVRPREVGEAWSAYSKRVMQADVWRQRPRDLCHYDLSLQGAPPSAGPPAPARFPCPRLPAALRHH